MVNAVFQIIALVTDESRVTVVLTILALGILLTIELMQHNGNLLEKINQQPLFKRQLAYAFFVAVILILGVNYIGEQQAFIYFQF